MADPRRILIVRPSALGDVCRTVPALGSLRAEYPNAKIDWLVRDAFAPAVSAHPALNAVVAFPRSRFARSLTSPAIALEAWRWITSLRAGKYDLVYDLQGLFRSAVFAFATRAPKRVGRSPSRELAFLGLTHRYRISRDAHDVSATLSLLRADGVAPIADMRLYTPPEDAAALHPHLASIARSGGRYAVLAPTARWPGKRWPADRFARLASALLERALVDAVAVVGAAGEGPQCAPLLTLAAADPRVVNLIGATSVGRLMAVIERSAIVIANDSAALHMAVGFARPLVALFGPTRIERVGPYGREGDVIQHVLPGDRFEHKHEPTGAAMMARITLEETLSACEARLSRVESDPRSALPRPSSPPPTITANAVSPA